MWIVAAFLVFGISVYSVLHKKKDNRRRYLRTQSLPAEWLGYIEENVSLYALLPPGLKAELHGDIQIFLDEKQFVGCGGLEITDEIKITVAASACVLLLNRKTKYYPTFTSILIYPSAYVAQEMDQVGFVQVKRNQVRLGESWRRGPVVLAWDHVLRGLRNTDDGHNVVIHEFAHKLDEEDGSMDGTPILNQRAHYASWAKILQPEFVKLQKKVKQNRKSVIDPYGATSPAEFFAVLTETFFEKPAALKRKHAELYEEMRQFYLVDPLGWRQS